MKLNVLFKGQVSIEYIFIVMVSFIIILPVIYSAMMQVQISIATTKAEIVCNKITSTADQLFATGEGSKTTIVVNLPKYIDSNNSFVSGREINYRLYTHNQGKDIFSIAKGNLTGTIPTSEGSHILSLEVVNGQVVINEGV